MRTVLKMALLLTTALALFLRAEDGERYALLIGVNEYNANSNLTALKYAETDMTQLAKALVDSGFKAENIRLMIQGEITDARFKPQKGSSDQFKPRKANIENELELLLKLKREQDTVIVAFAGHGIQMRDKDEIYYCPADAKVTDTNTLVELNGVVNQLKDSPAGAKLLIADCCRVNPLEEGLRADLGLKVESATRLVRIKPPESVATLFSCGKGEFAREEKEFNGGVFTHFLVEGLRGKAAQNGIVEIAGLASYVQLNVFEYVRKKYSASQTPDYKLNLGRPMILARRAKSAAVQTDENAQAGNKPEANGATRTFGVSAAQRLVMNSNATGQLVQDTSAGMDYAWTYNGNERTLALLGVSFKRYNNSVLMMDYMIDRNTAWGKNALGVTTTYTPETLPAQFQTARTYLGVPLYKIQLDDTGKVVSKTPLINKQASDFLEKMEWNIWDAAIAVHHPYMADQDEWTTEAEYGIGGGIMARGTMTMKKVPGGVGGQAVKVSCTFNKENFMLPGVNVLCSSFTLKVEGVQTYDTEAKEWIAGQFQASTAATFTGGTATGTGQSRFERKP
ncbi:MAG TPA: caspase family protein [Planctomycetota bacterium]|nr:caspase family protein [Planctomycetota bacterium]